MGKWKQQIKRLIFEWEICHVSKRKTFQICARCCLNWKWLRTGQKNLRLQKQYESIKTDLWKKAIWLFVLFLAAKFIASFAIFYLSSPIVPNSPDPNYTKPRFQDVCPFSNLCRLYWYSCFDTSESLSVPFSRVKQSKTRRGGIKSEKLWAMHRCLWRENLFNLLAPELLF